jgi:hypothetical protein
MGDGLLFATLATLVGKKNAARWMGARRVTIGAVGTRSGGERWVMGTLTDNTVVYGPPGDFSLPKPRKRHGEALGATG